MDMEKIGTELDELFNGSLRDRKIGFALLIFPFAGGEIDCEFVISPGISRKDTITIIKGLLARLECQPEVSGHA